MGKPALHQRLRTPGYPWKKVTEWFKNGQPKADPAAFQFGVRFTVGGRRYWDTYPTLDEALTRLKQAEVMVHAAKVGLAMPGQESKKQTLLASAVELYFGNLEARKADPKTIKTYRIAVNGFVASCKKRYVEDIDKQDLLDYMRWLGEQPMRKRKHGNPERTMFNKVGHVAIFLKAIGKPALLPTTQYPRYEEKMVTAHDDDELDLLYAHADAEKRFLLDYFLGSAVRDGDAAHAEFSDLKGNTLEIKRKPHLGWKPKKHHCRKITIPQSLADAIREREKKSASTLIFPNGEGKPNQHLLRDLQGFAERAGAKFHTELHKLRKTCATRWAVAGIPLHMIQKMLGHKSLATTQAYLADVDLSSGEMNEKIEKAAYAPKPKLAAAG
jgi:integrase/recombinase XerD